MTVKVPAQMPERLPTRIAFVGEAPSHEEVAEKRPFVGPAGRVFNAILRSANMERDDFLITNVFDEKAPDNDVSGWMKDEVRVAEAKLRLAEELAKARPNVIVPLGGTALWAFTGATLIAKFRGAVTAATQILPGAKLLPTFHPSAVQRAWHLLPLVVGDFIKADTEGDSPDFNYPRVDIWIDPTLDDIRQWVPELQASPRLSVDIETGWGQITSIAFAPDVTKALAVPIVDLRKPNRSYWPTVADEVQVWKLIRDVLEAPNPKVGQNYMYDLFWLYMQKGIATRNYRSDTRLRHKVLYPELPADLATMSASYTKVGAYKSWAGRYQKEMKKDG